MNKEPLEIDTSQLAHDYIYAYERVGEFFAGDFRDRAAFELQAEKVKSRPLKREPLASVLREQNRRYGCGSQTLENIDNLVEKQACAVVTGQQVGLFSGPLYTIYKSFTAIKLAERLGRNSPGSFVPVFWLASDDHDFAEIDHINLLNGDHQVEEIRYTSPLSHKKIPACELVFTTEVSDCIRRLEELTPASEFRSAILEHVKEAYRPGRTFAEAFANWMTRLFGSYGLILVDASHPALKELGKEVFYREIAESSPSTKRAIEDSSRLKRAGYHNQIQLHEGILNLFLTKEERQTIRVKGADYFIPGLEKTYTKRDLLVLLDKNPDRFSPNVLLRAIYQDALFPTVAYVGGPGEIAYFAQMKGTYESFEMPMPLFFPRATVTILERNIHKVLNRYDLKIGDIWHDAEGMIKDIIKKQVPASVEEVFRAAASHLERDFESIEREILSLEPTLKKSAGLALSRMKRQFDFLQKKVMRAAKRRHGVVTRQLDKVKNNLFPLDRLQERVFNIVPFLTKYGYGFMAKLYRELDIEIHEHQIMKL